jgi:hypothetical protein
MERVVRMRSEDRKPSKRVFPLLQNLDLDSVTFAIVQGVGDPITIEDLNEQEMQDLVLVNLARLAVSGEWTGLLEAGGGGGSDMWCAGLPTDSFEYPVSAFAGGIRGNTYAYVDDTLFMSPFSLGEAATITTARYHIAVIPSSTNVTIAIYETDDAGLPSALLGHNSTSQDTTGEKQITFAASMSLSADTVYWVGLSHDNASNIECTGCLVYVQRGLLPVIGTQAIDGNLNPTTAVYSYTWASSPPDPLTKSSIGTEGQTNSTYVPMIRLGI